VKELNENSSPEVINDFCKDGCPNSYLWSVYAQGASRNGRGDITIFRCSGGGHYCASDVGAINDGIYSNQGHKVSLRDYQYSTW